MLEWFGMPNDADLPSTFAIEYLHAWAVSIRGTRAQLDRFLDEYERQFQIKTGG